MLYAVPKILWGHTGRLKNAVMFSDGQPLIKTIIIERLIMQDFTERLVGDDIVEVDLASPWRRLAAVLINSLLMLLAYLPIAGVLFGAMETLPNQDGQSTEMLEQVMAQAGGSMAWLGVLGALLILLVVQVYLMSKYGQSIGKKVMGIRVLRTNGDNPGFFGTVFMREILPSLVIMGVSLFAAIFGGVAAYDLVSGLLQLAFFVSVVVMVFLPKIDRRTVADLIAGTVVVRLPKK